MASRRSSLAPALVAAMLLALCSPLVVADTEDTGYIPRHTGVDFPVGWADIDTNPFNPANNVQFRMVYPAMEDGEGAEMAGNGPFPWVAFFGDDGESNQGYMMLTEGLAKRGIIVLVCGALTDASNIEGNGNVLSVMREKMSQSNNSGSHVLGSYGNIALNHWGIAGHGTGGAAAYLLHPFYTAPAVSHQPPRAVFALGADFEDVPEDFEWSDGPQEATFSTPSVGLFLTGTVDEVAPSQESMERVEALDGVAWQWIHVLGGDHYQFQDTRSIFEREDDASLTQEEQIAFATDHIVPYLDTTLRADHSQFRSAFNRGQGPHIVSNTGAYIDENLDNAKFMFFENQTANYPASTELNGSTNLTIEVDWRLRNGMSYADLPQGWDVKVTCSWDGGVWGATGTLLANGTAQCHYPMASVPPGEHEAMVKVQVEGAPTIYSQSYSRQNVPIELVYPQPTIYLPQHGSTTLDLSEVAMDPDGQSVRAVEASLSGVDSNHFAITLAANGQNLVIEHALDEEWLGECEVDLQIRSDGEVDDQINTTLRVVLTPVNDQLNRIGSVPIQSMDEDGAPLMFDMRDAVEDPEGEALVISINDETIGEQGPVRYYIDGDILTFTPLDDANGAMVLVAMVSDGVNPALEVEVPVLVNAIDDPVRINQSAWSNLTVDEDALFVLDVGPLGYDVDGDNLTWTLESPTQDIGISWSNGTFQITPIADLNGVFGPFQLNVTDGKSTYNGALFLEVLPVPDLPFLSISNIQALEGGSTATMQWSVGDVDGAVNTDAEVVVDNQTVSVDHSCLTSTSTVFQCVSLIPLPATDEVVLVEVKVSDDELNRTVITRYLFDGSQASLVNDETSSKDDGSLVNIGAALVVLLLLFSVLGGGAFVYWRSSDDESDFVVEQEIEDGSDGDEPSGGLLARVARLK